VLKAVGQPSDVVAMGHDAAVHRPTLVIVEDEQEVADLLKLLFEFDGRIDVAAMVGDGPPGVELVARLRPTACILDLHMPTMHGTEALARMRHSSPATKIVVFSTYPDPYTLFDVLTHGADSYLDKATAWLDIVPTVAQLCGLPPEAEDAELEDHRDADGR